MAQKTITRLVDDLDETEIEDGAGQTVSFALDGTDYELDLTDENATALRSAFSRYVDAARKVSGPRSARTQVTRSPAKRDREQTQAIREWAKKQGLQVSERGRIAQTVVDQYNAGK